MTNDLETKFHQQMLCIYQTAKSDCGYHATRFHQMVNDRGGLATAKALLSSNQFPAGLTKLWECQRLDISMENLILTSPWNNLFTNGELAVAKKRLTDLGYSVV